MAKRSVFAAAHRNSGRAGDTARVVRHMDTSIQLNAAGVKSSSDLADRRPTEESMASANSPHPADVRHHSGDEVLVSHIAKQRHASDRRRLEPTSFASRLNRLFETIHPPGGGPLRDSDVRRELEAHGQHMSAPYLSQLRSGVRVHPHPKTICQLADLFGVRPEYFTGQDRAYTALMEAELHWLDLADDPDVRRITSALLELPPDLREDILRSAESGDRIAD